MSKRHSAERAKNYRTARSRDVVHWGGLIISFAILAIFIGLFYGLSAAGLPLMGNAATLIFVLAYAFGVYVFAVRPTKVRYDYASIVGVGMGLIFVVLNLFSLTSFGSILYSLMTSGTVLAVGVSVGIFVLGLVYLLTGFISARETKV